LADFRTPASNLLEVPMVQWHQAGQKIAGRASVHLVEHVVKVPHELPEPVVRLGKPGRTKVRHEYVGARVAQQVLQVHASGVGHGFYGVRHFGEFDFQTLLQPGVHIGRSVWKRVGSEQFPSGLLQLRPITKRQSCATRKENTN